MTIYATWPHAPKHFETMDEAFAFCREKDSPVTVTIDGQLWKLFPSGKAVDTGKSVSAVSASRS